MWHSWKFGHKWISEYIRIKIFTQTNIRIYLYKNLTRTDAQIGIRLENCTNIQIYSNICLGFYTLTHWRMNVWIYSNKQIWYKRMSEYIRKRKIDRNNIWIYIRGQYIQKFEYSNIFVTLWFKHHISLWDTFAFTCSAKYV